MEMKKCKECGKLFTPKGREQYCQDVHYRPCPTCGEPVVAKYLSDPPRRCDKCKHVRKPANQQPAQQEVKTTDTKPTKHKNPFSNAFAKMDNKFSFEPKAKEVIEAKPEPKENEVQIDTSNLILDIPGTVNQSEFCEKVSGTVRAYIGPVIRNGFVPGHEYLMKVTHNDYTYEVSSLADLTSNEDVDILVNYASQIMINRYFACKKTA